MIETEKKVDNITRFEVVPDPITIMDVANSSDIIDSDSIFDEDDGSSNDRDVILGANIYKIKMWGGDNELPYNIAKFISESSVMSQNKLFNVLTCYGAGIKFVDKETKEQTEDQKIDLFYVQNSIREFFIEQITDMKYYFFSVDVIILNRARTEIVGVRHMESCNCRFTKANKGRIENVLVANWRCSSLNADNVQVYPLLDEINPIGDLRIRMGLDADPFSGNKRKKTKECAFAVLSKFPTVGQRYYPFPYYAATFADDWYDIARLIGQGKKMSLKNNNPLRYQVEIHEQYWQAIFRNEKISDPEKQAARIKLEKKNIEAYLSGSKNASKMMISGFSTTPEGNEVHYVKINCIDMTKAGGDWSDDIAEANNMECYGDNIHPNLVGATPGKSQQNNSGSDKRELFTLKQYLEGAFHDMLMKVYNTIIYINGWNTKIRVDIPIITLTTLDQNKDAKVQTVDKPADNNISDDSKRQ